MTKDIEDLKAIEAEQVENLRFEFVNVLNKPRNPQKLLLMDCYGPTSIKHNGLPPRTRHEINNGLRVVQELGVTLCKDVINLPFTVAKGHKVATTAFTDRTPELRNIYLVPDHTPTRIMIDKSYHLDGFDELLQEGQIGTEVHKLCVEAVSNLTVGDRVAASILHEYGHILTYEAFDADGVESYVDIYDWLDREGYLDNCSYRVATFNEQPATFQINIALELLAEDYRLSCYIKNGDYIFCLPHSIGFMQDIINTGNFLKGVEIMGKLLKINSGCTVKSSSNKKLDSVLPFGEAPRTNRLMSGFTRGPIKPLTEEDKKRARAELKLME